MTAIGHIIILICNFKWPSAYLLSFQVIGVFIHLVTEIVSGLELIIVDSRRVHFGQGMAFYFFSARLAKLIG